MHRKTPYPELITRGLAPASQFAPQPRCIDCGKRTSLVCLSCGRPVCCAPNTGYCRACRDKDAAETREQANRRRVAEKLAEVMRDRGVLAADARLAGLGASTKTQRVAEKLARQVVAQKARCRDGYIPSDATWELACEMLLDMWDAAIAKAEGSDAE